MDIKSLEVINKINKDKKAVKVTTLSQAKAMHLKRYFSGSIVLDNLLGGGAVYKRIHLLYGQKSAGKNAHLNQLIAYNQRLCKNCGGVIPTTDSNDKKTLFLLNVLGYPLCECDLQQRRVFMILDYERSLSLEEAKTGVVAESLYIDTETGEVIESDEYKDNIDRLDILRQKKSLTPEEIEEANKIEKFLSKLETKEVLKQKSSTLDYLRACGILDDELLVAEPEDTEEGIDIVKQALKTNDIDGIIWDSIQAAIPRTVKDRDSDQETMGKEPKINGLLMRQICAGYSARDLTDPTEAYKPSLFIISQVRENLGPYASAPTYSGGRALEHHISVAIEFKRVAYLKELGVESSSLQDVTYGQRVRLRLEKNKLALPMRMGEYDYYFATTPCNTLSTGSIDHVREIVQLGVIQGIIEKAGSFYKLNGKSYHGLNELLHNFRENTKLLHDLYLQVKGF